MPCVSPRVLASSFVGAGVMVMVLGWASLNPGSRGPGTSIPATGAVTTTIPIGITNNNPTPNPNQVISAPTHTTRTTDKDTTATASTSATNVVNLPAKNTTSATPPETHPTKPRQQQQQQQQQQYSNNTDDVDNSNKYNIRVGSHKLTGLEDATILITGCAGFIGAHTALSLRQAGHVVVGLDNMNNYYDVRLKYLRATIIRRAGVIFEQGDMCDDKFMSRLFSKYQFTHIVHLAAQAGVRYSSVNPHAYGMANVVCSIAVFEQAKSVMRNVGGESYPVVLFASSSSVYGRTRQIPFKESQRTDMPISIYAATKQSTEQIAYSYQSLYNLRITGLRFFTVYGPLGRPDMAAWMWAKSIKEGNPITLYQTKDKTPLLRDFTYIDDIIDGVVGAMELGADWAIFNLGRGEPQNVTELIVCLENEFHKKADIKIQSLPPGDVPLTFADTSRARELLGYRPKVSIRDGVRKFVEWFKDYTPVSLPANFTWATVHPDDAESIGVVA